MPRAFASRARLLLLLCGLLPAPCLSAQAAFHGQLEPGLHVDPQTFTPAILDAMSVADARELQVETAPADKVFAGELTLPRGGSLRYKTVVVRHADSTDVLYLDRNRDGRFEPDERLAFHTASSGDPRLKSTVSTDVALPGSLFSTTPMEIGLMREGVRSPARPDQLAMAYTAALFVQGKATLPDRTVAMRFQYNPETQSVSPNQAAEWIDLNGDGMFDITPGSGEFLHADGAPPIFQIGTSPLRLSSINLEAHTFELATVSAAEDRRIPLTVGAQLPDFSFEDLHGARHQLSDLKGGYLLLDFWATWCAPCMAELPQLKDDYAAFHPRGLEILAIDGDKSADPAKAVVQQQHLAWPQAQYDANLIENRFQISVWPTLVLVDLSGGRRTIISVGLPDHLPLDPDHLHATLTSVLGH